MEMVQELKDRIRRTIEKCLRSARKTGFSEDI
jgi:hypothetical protein